MACVSAIASSHGATPLKTPWHYNWGTVRPTCGSVVRVAAKGDGLQSPFQPSSETSLTATRSKCTFFLTDCIKWENSTLLKFGRICSYIILVPLTSSPLLPFAECVAKANGIYDFRFRQDHFCTACARTSYLGNFLKRLPRKIIKLENSMRKIFNV